MIRLPKRLRPGHEQRHRSAKQEEATAAKFGGRVTPGSGSGRQKADVRVPGFARVECKTTRHRSFRVTADMMKKLEDAALGTDEIVFLEVELEDVGKVYVLPEWAIERIIEYCDATPQHTK